MRLKDRTYQVLDVAASGDRASRLFDIFIVSLIGLNVLTVILQSVAAIESDTQVAPRLGEPSSGIGSVSFARKLMTRVLRPTYAISCCSVGIRGRRRRRPMLPAPKPRTYPPAASGRRAWTVPSTSPSTAER